MSDTRRWKDVRKQVVKPVDEPYIKQGREAIRAELRLAGLRKRRKASQAGVAKALSVSQSNISQLERGVDVKLSTIKSYVEALGGRLEMSAVFDDERVPLAASTAASMPRPARPKKSLTVVASKPSSKARAKARAKQNPRLAK